MKKTLSMYLQRHLAVIVLLLLCNGCFAQSTSGSNQLWITYKGGKGPGEGNHIVLVSGDEEYRSEEALPALAKLLSERHGFKCTVLFAIDPRNGTIDPSVTDNIPGLHLLEEANMVILFTRFRNLPAEQMIHFENYLKEGKPIVALRTATHAFNFPKDSPYFKYSYNSGIPGWEGGFGRVILGETWISHHGEHGKEGTLARSAGSDHPILTGVGQIWVPTDVYTARPPADADVLLLGYVTRGMSSQSPIRADMQAMPVAWTRTYRLPSGSEGRVFTTTMGSAVDLLDNNFRRLLVNAAFWATGIENQIEENLGVDFNQHFRPTMFGFDTFKRNVLPIEAK